MAVKQQVAGRPRSLFTPDGRGALAGRLGPRTLWVLDFDGTLAPIVRWPDQARMRARTRTLLARLARTQRLALLSGRARDDVRERGQGVAWVEVLGNHGLEPSPAAARLRPLVAGWRRQLERALAGVPGVEIEDKRLSLSLHYRGARDRRAAEAAVRAALAALPARARVTPGKLVFNVLPTARVHKGSAVKRLRRQLGAREVIFVGDDVTDEDVFELRAPWLFGVRVGAGATAAAWRLPDQRAVDRLLELAISLSEAGAR